MLLHAAPSVNRPKSAGGSMVIHSFRLSGLGSGHGVLRLIDGIFRCPHFRNRLQTCFQGCDLDIPNSY